MVFLSKDRLTYILPIFACGSTSASTSTSITIFCIIAPSNNCFNGRFVWVYFFCFFNCILSFFSYLKTNLGIFNIKLVWISGYGTRRYTAINIARWYVLNGIIIYLRRYEPTSINRRARWWYIGHTAATNIIMRRFVWVIWIYFQWR